MSIPPFHLAFPVHDLEAARNFYGALLGCREGRSDRDWVDYDFFGPQIVAHVAPASVAARAAAERGPRRHLTKSRGGRLHLFIETGGHRE